MLRHVTKLIHSFQSSHSYYNDIFSCFLFIICLTDGISNRLNSGIKVFDYLQKNGQIGTSDMSYLAELFENIHRKDVALKIKKYEERIRQLSSG